MPSLFLMGVGTNGSPGRPRWVGLLRGLFVRLVSSRLCVALHLFISTSIYCMCQSLCIYQSG